MKVQRVTCKLVRNMSTPAVTMSPFSHAVVSAMRKLYPESLADKSFDNIGLLLEAPYRKGYLKNSALLTIDLTKAVAEEAITRRDSIIVTYHPIIFRPLKSITLQDSQQKSLLRLAQEGISVYSPHTAVDAVSGGLNDWLADILIGENSASSAEEVDHRSAITPVSGAPKALQDAGYGRILRLTTPSSLAKLLERLRVELSSQSLCYAIPQRFERKQDQLSKIPIESIGICVGSGSMLNGLDVDLLVTGELSHHEALAAIENDRCVIATFHSNSERAFLKQRMQATLQDQVQAEISEAKMEGAWDDSLATDFDIAVSSVDRDPYETITWA